VAIGDISGKGVGAALLMALTSSAVESQGRQLEHPAQVLAALNQLLAPRLQANHMNAALQFVVLDPERATLRVANAGMIAPVLISKLGNRFLDVGGLPLGAFSGAQYFEAEVALEADDTLLLVSDGVVEAHNEEGELFGFERLEQVIADIPSRDLRVLVDMVLARVQEHIGEAEQHDDITIVAVRPQIWANRAMTHEEQAIDYAAV
jgi:serine phosphatase RsbU (regulator of sigma subunit)